jgi:hypothetical protein
VKARGSLFTLKLGSNNEGRLGDRVLGFGGQGYNVCRRITRSTGPMSKAIRGPDAPFFKPNHINYRCVDDNK